MRLAAPNAADDGVARFDWACDLLCFVQEQKASCRDRVSWLVWHTSHDAWAAYNEVRQSCPSCDRCLFTSVNETTPAPVTSTTITTTTLPYDCDMHVAWIDSWDIRKKA